MSTEMPVTGETSLSNMLIPTALGVLPYFGGFMSNTRKRDACAAWMNRLRRPWWAPPRWVFRPLWLTLYGFMSAASMLVWERRLISPALVKKALFAYAGTLCLNFSFNPFIISKNVLVATLIQAISLPWNIFTAWSFYRVAPSAGYLMMPNAIYFFYSLPTCIAVYVMNERREIDEWEEEYKRRMLLCATPRTEKSEKDGFFTQASSSNNNNTTTTNSNNKP